MQAPTSSLFKTKKSIINPKKNDKLKKNQIEV